MINFQADLNFKGLYGCYSKNNRKYAINLKQSNTAIEVIKESDGLNTLKFYKNYAMEKESVRTIKNVQVVEINKIDDESGAILNSDDTFKIKTVEAYNTFIEIGKKAKILIDKMETGLIYIDNVIGSKEQRAFIKKASGVSIRNMHTDYQLDVRIADNLVLSNTDVNERIGVKGDKIHFSTNNNLDLLI